jgi:hypothetical protein
MNNELEKLKEKKVKKKFRTENAKEKEIKTSFFYLGRANKLCGQSAGH